MDEGLAALLSDETRRVMRSEEDRLEAELERLRLQLDHGKRAVREAENRIALCERALTFVRKIGRGSGNDLSVEHDPERHTVPPESVVETAIRVLLDNGNSALHYRSLADEVESRGVRIGRKDAAATLLALITNAKYVSQFERAGRGVYRLRDSSSSKGSSALSKPSARRTRRRRRAKRSGA